MISEGYCIGMAEQAISDFARAEAIEPSDPDIYYHRGQVHFIQGDEVHPARNITNRKYVEKLERDLTQLRQLLEAIRADPSRARLLLDRTS